MQHVACWIQDAHQEMAQTALSNSNIQKMIVCREEVFESDHSACNIQRSTLLLCLLNL